MAIVETYLHSTVFTPSLFPELPTTLTPETLTLTRETTVTLLRPTYSSVYKAIETNTMTSHSIPPYPLQHLSQAKYLWPVLLTFAIFGMLAILSLLVYGSVHLCRYLCKSPNTSLNLSIPTLSFHEKHIFRQQDQLPRTFPWLSRSSSSHETLAFQNSARDLIANKEAYKASMVDHRWLSRFLHRPMAPPTEVNRSSSPTIQFVSTFVPIDDSPLTLVPRSDILNDPQRRRGVDEVDLWEQKQKKSVPLWRFPSRDYPESPEVGPSSFSALSGMQLSADPPYPRAKIALKTYISSTSHGSDQTIALSDSQRILSSTSQLSIDERSFPKFISTALSSNAPHMSHPTSDVMIARETLKAIESNDSSHQFSPSGSKSFF
ncbi:hypothetical protein BDF14DRAFT_1750886 [Spinellus fusiger]|nr:hypothetical protein BDF14DRAFT_1750886 [Spinellus fusiger]